MATTTTVSANQTLIKNFYKILTLAQPADSQLAVLAQRVDTNVATLSETLRGIYDSPSRVAGPADEVATLFFLLFGRAPDPILYNAAMESMRAGASLASLATIGLGMPGYALSSDGAKSNQDFVDTLYQQLTQGRSIATVDLAYYVTALNTNTMTRGGLVAAAAESNLFYPASKIPLALIYLAAAQREASSIELTTAPSGLDAVINLAMKAAGVSPTGGKPSFALNGSLLSLSGEMAPDLVFNLADNKFTLGGVADFKALYSSNGGLTSAVTTFNSALTSGVYGLDARGMTDKGKITFTGRAAQGNEFYAGTADSVAVGGTGNDVLVGGAGSDKLTATTGRDVLTGGAGSDTFVFAPSTAYISGNSFVSITDFGNGADKLDTTFLLNKNGTTTTAATPTTGAGVVLATSTAAVALSNGDTKLIENNGKWTTGTGTATLPRAATAVDVAALFNTANTPFLNPTQTGKFVLITADIRNGADMWLINNDTGVTQITDGVTGPQEVFLVGHIDGSWNLVLSGLQPVAIA